MKKIKLFVAAVQNNAAVILGLGIIAGALVTVSITRASQLWQGSYTSVTNTTIYSVTNAVITNNLALANLQISDLGLTNLTDLTNVCQLSIDGGAHWISVSTNQPTSTGAGTWLWTIGSVPIVISERIATTTTNGGGISVNIYQP
jgi:hypothetical protein